MTTSRERLDWSLAGELLAEVDDEAAARLQELERQVAVLRAAAAPSGSQGHT